MIKIIYIVIFFCFLLFYYPRVEQFTENTLPNNIWMYWENKPGTKRPAYLDLCYKTVLKHCSDDFNIILLNEKSIYKYLPNIRKDLDRKLNIPQKTDYYRYWLLYMYGGIWLDFDIIVFKSLIPMLKKLEKFDYVGAGCHYSNCNKTGYPKPANWVMVSKKKTSFIKNCINECDKLLDSSVTEINYFKLGRITMWDNIKKKITNNKWKYYHYDSKCLERDSKYKKLKNKRLITNEDIDSYCINKLLFIPIYNTSPGFPKWFKKMTENEILKSNMLISKYFRKSLE